MSKAPNKDPNAIGWNDPIDSTEPERIVLPDGEAMFVVEKLERARKPFGKFGTQNVAVIHCRVSSVVEGAPDDSVLITANLALVQQLKWKILQFFTAIGQRKHGDDGAFVPNWAKVEGETGRCKIGHRDLTRKDGSAYQVNDIVEFLAPDGQDDNLQF